MAVDTTAHTSNTIKREGIMKYYFILTDGKDAWMQFVYLPSGDYVSGYIRDLRSVGISVHDTMTFGQRTHAPLPSVPSNTCGNG